MKILVSACLLGHNCKYNGGNNLNQKVLDFLEGNEIIPICPESAGGLPIPRPPAEIVNGKVINKEGKSVDAEFRKGSMLTLEKALNSKAELAILKANSPSCGSGQIYDGTFSKKLIKGDGVFAHLLKQHNIKILTENDL